MKNKQKLLEIAKNIKGFAELINEVNDKAKSVDVSDLMGVDVPLDKENTYLDYYLNKKIREVFEGLFNGLKQKSKTEVDEMFLFISLCAYHQDWDYVFETIRELRGETFFAWHDNEEGENVFPFDVKSWGNMPQNYDVHFLNQIRNGFAHSKFEYDPSTKMVTISRNNGQFVVESPLTYLVSLPNQIWEMSEQSYSQETRQSTIFLTAGNYLNGVRVVVKNQDPGKDEDEILKRLHKLGFNDNQLIKLNLISRLVRSSDKLTLVYKMKEVERLINYIFTNDHKFDKSGNTLEIVKLIYEKFGLTIEEEQQFNVLIDVCNNNEFLKTLFASMLNSNNVSESEQNAVLIRSLNIKQDQLSKNFLAFNAATVLLLSIHNSGQSWGKFRDVVKNSYIPYSIDEISMFLDKAYLNFVYNYLIEKNKEADDPNALINSISNIPAVNYFDDNDYTHDLSMHDACYFIRNCVVHPKFLERKGDKYIFTDINKKGEVVFHSEIEREKLMKITSLIVEELAKGEVLQENTEESDQEKE